MKLIPFYDDPSFDYKKYWRERQYENQADKIALKRLLRFVPEKGRLIDIGAGFGRLASVYAPQFGKCVLIDPSVRMLAEAQNRFKKQNLQFVKAYVEKLPFKDKSFDVAIFIRILHHLKSPSLALKEAVRILKPGGFLILEFANKLHFKARLKACLRFDFGYFSDLQPLKVGMFKKCEVPFLNYHPQYINNLLTKAGFKIIKTLSVSNFRSSFCKKILPLKFLLFLETLAQIVCSTLQIGPSTFILAQKK